MLQGLIEKWCKLPSWTENSWQLALDVLLLAGKPRQASVYPRKIVIGIQFAEKVAWTILLKIACLRASGRMATQTGASAHTATRIGNGTYFTGWQPGHCSSRRTSDIWILVTRQSLTTTRNKFKALSIFPTSLYQVPYNLTHHYKTLYIYIILFLQPFIRSWQNETVDGVDCSSDSGLLGPVKV